MSRVRHGSPRKRWGAAAVLLAAALGVAGWKVLQGAGDIPVAPPPKALAAAPAPVIAEELTQPARPAAAEPPPEPAHVPIRRPIKDLDPETRAALQARLDREKAADERFEQGLVEARVTGRDVDARVRDAFQRVELTPDLLDGGRMRGLRIRAVEGGSALAEAGFRPGDLLVRLDGETPDDPAELARLMASVGPELSLCAERAGTEFCRELILR